MTNPTPQRSTARVSGVPRRVGRVLEHAVQSDSRYGNTLEVGQDGRLDIKLTRNDSGLELTKEGLRLADAARGEMNRPQMNRVDDLATGASAATILAKVNELLAELRRTTHMKSGGL